MSNSFSIVKYLNYYESIYMVSFTVLLKIVVGWPWLSAAVDFKGFVHA